MEVILKKDVENLGFKDDVVAVKNGYGRNFLIPQGMAVMATPSAKKVLAENLRQRAHREAKVLEDAKKIATALEAMTIKIIAKTADGSKLFGSVSSSDLAEAFAKQGQELESKFIKLDGNTVKRIGKYTAHVRLHRSLVVDVPFEVAAENTVKAKAETVEVAPKAEVSTEENTAE
ncbi:MAG: 50S ribosomal protein L9 [Flavobacteriaceae bacterium]|nr:50S ribosomal protein L9 [Flavobacteriaceae bacterium]